VLGLDDVLDARDGVVVDEDGGDDRLLRFDIERRVCRR
jgi:hypothetical protein